MKDLQKLTITELHNLLCESINKAAIYQSELQRRHLNHVSKVSSQTKNKSERGVSTTKVCRDLSIIADKASGKPIKEICKEYGVSKSTIYRICK